MPWFWNAGWLRNVCIILVKRNYNKREHKSGLVQWPRLKDDGLIHNKFIRSSPCVGGVLPRAMTHQTPCWLACYLRFVSGHTNRENKHHGICWCNLSRSYQVRKSYGGWHPCCKFPRKKNPNSTVHGTWSRLNLFSAHTLKFAEQLVLKYDYNGHDVRNQECSLSTFTWSHTINETPECWCTTRVWYNTLIPCELCPKSSAQEMRSTISVRVDWNQENERIHWRIGTKLLQVRHSKPIDSYSVLFFVY